NDYFGARYYASTMGRWLSPDPSGLELADPENPQGLNLYSYVLNNPLGFIDPDGMECVWDDGSFDSKDDKQTGSSKSCGKAGGTWIDPKAFSTLNAGDWSDKANANIAGIAQDLNSSSTTVTVTAQDPGVVGALPLETPQTTQQIDPDQQRIKQLAIGITVDSQHSFGCIAQAYGIGVPGTAAYQLGQPVAGTKRFVSPGSSVGSSPISEGLSKALPIKGRFPAPVGGPGTGVPFRMTKTGNLGRALGRWAPFVGLAADAYAAAQLAHCL
ncbi:MAG: RHS repeat-associated core domain-containing protein, partial [Acidobacteriota bacterium]